MENAVKDGLTKEEIMSQIDLMLDKDAQKRIRRSESDIRADGVKRFRSALSSIPRCRHLNQTFSVSFIDVSAFVASLFSAI